MIEAEVIGPGKLLYGPIEESALPDPLAPGAPIGQHLRVERLLRVCPQRTWYLVNNLGPKWARRKCWQCGNRYSPNRAQACTYCATPLRDLRFLATARWERPLFEAWQAWLALRRTDAGVVRPVAVLYRGELMISVYHYHGEGLLIDEPAPLSSHRLLRMADKLTAAISFLHDTGVVLRRLGPEHVLMMPDGTARLYDVDIDELLADRDAVYRHPAQPPRRDVRTLAALLLDYCAPGATDLVRFLRGAAHGTYATPLAFRTALSQLFSALDLHHGAHRAAAFSDAGLVRSNNEDSWRWLQLSEGATLYVVADGMGGHDGGEIASQLAVDRVCRSAVEGMKAEDDLDALTEGLRDAMHAANRDVLFRATSGGIQMGTTLVAAIVIDDPPTAIVANAGDSRAYLLRDEELHRITRDHTVVAELLQEGTITEAEAATHPAANMLTTTVGADEELSFDVFRVQLLSGDRLMLCSDGLWGHVSDEELGWVASAHRDRREVVQSLVRSAYADGGSDNLTLLLIDIP